MSIPRHCSAESYKCRATILVTYYGMKYPDGAILTFTEANNGLRNIKCSSGYKYIIDNIALNGRALKFYYKE